MVGLDRIAEVCMLRQKLGALCAHAVRGHVLEASSPPPNCWLILGATVSC